MALVIDNVNMGNTRNTGWQTPATFGMLNASSKARVLHEPDAFVPSTPSTSQPRFGGSQWLRNLALAATMLLTATPAIQQARAEISPESAKVMTWVEKSTKTVEGKDRAWKDLSPADWNNVIVGLRVTDNVGELDLHPLRMRILKEAPSNPDIPLRVVHDAINTAGVIGSVLTDDHVKVSRVYKDSGKKAADIKREISDTLRYYEQRVIVDSRNAEFEKQRTFVDKSSSNAGSPGDFSQPAMVARAKIADPATYQQLERALLQPGIDNARRDQLFDMIRLSTAKLPKVEKWSVEQIFTADNLDKAAKKTPAEASSGGAADVFKGLFNFGPSAPSKLSTSLPDALKSPELPKIDDSAKPFVAKQIEYLTQQNNPMALIAASQWMARLDAGLVDVTVTPEGNIRWNGDKVKEPDLRVLKSLAVMAQRDPAAKAVLYQTMASQPALVFHTLLNADRNYESQELVVDAGLEVGKALRTDKANTQKLVKAMAQGNAPWFWDESKAKPDEKIKLSKVRRDGQTMAMAFMLVGDSSAYLPELRSAAFDETHPLRGMATFALVNAQDQESIAPLMKIAANPLEGKARRAEALESVLTIVGPPLMDPNIRDQAVAAMPFSVAGVRPFMMTDKTGDMILNPNARPLAKLREDRFNAWQSQETANRALVAKTGRELPAITLEEQVYQRQRIWRDMFGGPEQATRLATMGKDAAFQRDVLAPLHDELKTGELDMMLPVLDVLGKSNYRPAADTIANLVRTPEKHVKFPDGMSPSTRVQVPVVVKAQAAQALGGVVDPASELAQIPHRLMRDPFVPFQFSAIEALSRMGKQTMADDVRAQHVEKSIGHLTRLQSGYHDVEQRRRIRDFLGYEMAKATVDLGGTDALAAHALALQKTNPTHPLLRTVAHGMINRGVEPKSAEAKAALTQFFSSGGYWGLPKLHEQGFTGQGTTALWFDVGYITPLKDDPAMAKLVHHPSWIRWNDIAGNFDVTPHSTATFKTYLQTAPGTTRVDSYNVNETIRPATTASDTERDAFFMGLEEAVQNQIRAKGDPQRTEASIANYSIGIANAALHDKRIREELIDLIGAYMDGLGHTGVLNVASAGNSQAQGPFSQFGPIGTVNNLGSRWRDGKLTKSDSTVLVAAADSFLNWLAEFSSVSDPLRPEEALSMVAAPGYQEMTWWREDGKWQMMPVDGTSFSAPRMSGLTRVVLKARESKGLPALTYGEYYKAVRESTTLLPGREDWEGGSLVNPVRLLQLLTTPAAKAPELKK